MLVGSDHVEDMGHLQRGKAADLCQEKDVVLPQMLHEWIQEKAEAWRRQLHREDKANNDQLVRLCCGACKGRVLATSDEEDPGPLAVGKRLSSGALAQVQAHPV